MQITSDNNSDQPLKMESTKILINGRRLPTPILFGLNIPAVVQIQITELNENFLDGNVDKRQVCFLFLNIRKFFLKIIFLLNIFIATFVTMKYALSHSILKILKSIWHMRCSVLQKLRHNTMLSL